MSSAAARDAKASRLDALLAEALVALLSVQPCLRQALTMQILLQSDYGVWFAQAPAAWSEATATWNCRLLALQTKLRETPAMGYQQPAKLIAEQPSGRKKTMLAMPAMAGRNANLMASTGRNPLFITCSNPMVSSASE